MPAEATASALFGEPMTLQEAHTRAGFALRLPTAEPADREPDRIYVQDLPDLPEQPGAKATIAVWDGESALSLYQIQGPHYGMKVAWANALVETSVDGHLAYWVGGPHPLLLGNGERWSIVAGDVLVWVDGTYTYRLESSLSMEEAVRVAESLE
jgi:hypothetical protein